MFLSKLFKRKSTKLLTLFGALAMTLGAGAAARQIACEQQNEVMETMATTSVLGTSDGNLVYYQCNQDWNKDWWGDSARIFVYFFDDSKHSCWTSTYVNQDQYKYYYNSSDDSTLYFCYPSSTEYKWTKAIFVRKSNTSTEGSWDDKWDQTCDVPLSGINVVKPIGNSGPSGSRNVDKWVDGSIGSKTISSGTSLYFEDYGGNSANNAIIQAHLWGNIEQCSEVYINMTQVHGNFNGGEDPDDHPLYECTVPNSGGYVNAQFKRLDPSDQHAWDTSGDYTCSSTNNVFKATSVIAGSFDWCLSDSQRVNMFTRYILDQTSSCTENEEDVDLSGLLTAGWGNCKTQYDNMSKTNQGSFWTASASDSGAPGEGVKRYDRLVYLYGYERGDPTSHYGKRNHNLEDFANRHASDAYAYKNAAHHIPNGYSKESTPLTTTLWIVLASGLAGLAAIGTAYFVSKKKRHQA